MISQTDTEQEIWSAIRYLDLVEILRRQSFQSRPTVRRKKEGNIDDPHERCNEATHNCCLDGGYRLRLVVRSIAGD
jgi:hypothetical protein